MSIEQEASVFAPAASRAPLRGGNAPWIIGGGIVLVVLLGVGLYVSSPTASPRDAATETYTATGENGEQITYSAGEDVALPDNWPATVPVVPDAVVTSAGAVDSDDGPAIMATFTTERSVDETAAFYQTELTDSGWNMSDAMKTDSASVLLGTLGLETSVMVSISAVEEKTNVGIAIQNVK